MHRVYASAIRLSVGGGDSLTPAVASTLKKSEPSFLEEGRGMGRNVQWNTTRYKGRLYWTKALQFIFKWSSSVDDARTEGHSKMVSNGRNSLNGVDAPQSRRGSTDMRDFFLYLWISSADKKIFIICCPLGASVTVLTMHDKCCMCPLKIAVNCCETQSLCLHFHH